MITCSLAIIIQGTIDTGGIDHIVKTNYEHGRLNFFKYVAKPIYLIVGILQHVITTVSKIIFFLLVLIWILRLELRLCRLCLGNSLCRFRFLDASRILFRDIVAWIH